MVHRGCNVVVRAKRDHSMATESPEVFEFLLNCQICAERFDQKVRIPRVLPCHHTFCSPCIAKLDRGGVLTCPNDCKEFQVSGPFPVDFTRAALVEHKNVLLQKGSASFPLEEACQKHQDKKLEFFCSSCKNALCSECAFIEHKDKTGHDIEKLGDVLEQVKGEVESRCVELDKIRVSSLQPRAKMAATCLQETDASFKAAEQEIEDVFSEAVNVLLDRKAKVVEELRGKWKGDRMEREEQALATASQVSGAKTSTVLGRTVSSVGLPSHIVAQEQELQRAVQEARAEGKRPLKSSLRYKVNTNLLGLVKSIQDLGTVYTDNPQFHEATRPEPRRKERQTVTSHKQSPSKSMTSSKQSAGNKSAAVTSPRQPAMKKTSAMTSSTIQTPEFQLEPGWCNAECTLAEDGKILTNKPRDQPESSGQTGVFHFFRRWLHGSRPFTFPGTCGSVDLAQPALHFWTVSWELLGEGRRDLCEVGLASLHSLQTCRREERISDHDIEAPTIVLVEDKTGRRLEGRGWSKDVDAPPLPVIGDTPYTCLETGVLEMTLGFLYDNRRPQSPRVLVVETESCRFLGVRRLSPSPDLRPVLRVGPPSPDFESDVYLEVGTGPGVLDDVTAGVLQSLLGRMER